MKELIEVKGISQMQLAQDNGISQAAIVRWEANLQTSNIDIAIMFVIYFGVTADYLLGFEK